MVISIGTAVHKTLTTTPNLSYIPVAQDMIKRLKLKVE